MRTPPTKGSFPPSHRLARRVRCNRSLKHLFFTSGVHYWEVDVARMDKHSSAMVVGAVPSERFDDETLNGPRSTWTDGAVGYAASGVIIQNGVEIATSVEPFQEGDVVGVLLNLNARTIAFFLNGREIAHVDSNVAPTICLEKTPRHALPQGKKPGKRLLLEPIPFTPHAMFAAVTFSPDTDRFDVFSTSLPRSPTT